MTDTGIALEAVEASGRGAAAMFFRNKAAVFGLALFTGIVVMSIFGPGWYGVTADDMVARPFAPPGDEFGPGGEFEGDKPLEQIGLGGAFFQD